MLVIDPTLLLLNLCRGNLQLAAVAAFEVLFGCRHHLF